MGEIHESIDERMAAWIGQQHVFFVATAPLEFVEDRTVLDLHQEKKGPAAYVGHAEGVGARSIDGLPALTRQG